MPTVKDIIIRKPTKEEIKTAEKWPIWEKGVSSFEWVYTEIETCLIIEGEVNISDKSGAVSFGKGDWVVFPVDLECVWNIKKAVRKYYNFS